MERAGHRTGDWAKRRNEKFLKTILLTAIQDYLEPGSQSPEDQTPAPEINPVSSDSPLTTTKLPEAALLEEQVPLEVNWWSVGVVTVAVVTSCWFLGLCLCSRRRRASRLSEPFLASVHLSQSGTVTITKPDSKRVITSDLPLSDLIVAIDREEWGCKNLTSELIPETYSEYPIGTGGSGDVYSAKLKNGTKVAVKIVRPLNTDIIPGKYRKRAAKELRAWARCEHRNVAPLLGFAEFRENLAMLSPWAQHGSLARYLSKTKILNRCSLSASVCDGLAYLHKNDIIHGDLKAANVLVSADGVPMLTDFGNARLAGTSGLFTATSTIGFSLRWAAPEILKACNEPDYVTNEFSRQADVYALGMTVLEIFTAEPPFAGISDRLVFSIVVNAKRIPRRPESQIPTSSICGNVLWSLLASCWAHDPKLRPGAEYVGESIKLITESALERIEIEPVSGPGFWGWHHRQTGDGWVNGIIRWLTNWVE